MKIYRSLYYNLFQIWLKKRDEPENAHINAVITTTFLLYVNIMNIPLILVAIFKKEVIDLPEINMNIKVWIVAFLVGGGILNYILLGRRKRHNEIIEEFKTESEVKKRKSFYFTVL